MSNEKFFMVQQYETLSENPQEITKIVYHVVVLHRTNPRIYKNVSITHARKLIDLLIRNSKHYNKNYGGHPKLGHVEVYMPKK